MACGGVSRESGTQLSIEAFACVDAPQMLKPGRVIADDDGNLTNRLAFGLDPLIAQEKEQRARAKPGWHDEVRSICMHLEGYIGVLHGRIDESSPPRRERTLSHLFIGHALSRKVKTEQQEWEASKQANRRGVKDQKWPVCWLHIG